MAHKYELIVFWSSEDDAFLVDVPDLPGCMAHGATRAEAVAEAERAIDLWIDTARDLGRTVPQPRARAVNQARGN
jgi:predicted RNase H-like HicB family nuclease